MAWKDGLEGLSGLAGQSRGIECMWDGLKGLNGL